MNHSENSLPTDFFEKMVENCIFEIFVTDQKGTILYMNPISKFLTGRTDQNIIGRNVCDIVNDGTISDSATLKVLKEKKTCKVVLKSSGGENLVSISSPIFNEKGEIEYVITTAQNSAELNELSNSLIRENLHLQQEIKLLSRMKEEYINSDDIFLSGKVYDHIITELSKVAPLDISILIRGETGTGKTDIAKLVHKLGKNSSGPFIKINCGMIPENLFESELFGYEEGAFTGAAKGGKVGKVELADNGTLFLDEIGELPLSVQVKLLDFIQEKTITRVGGHKKIPINTRIVTATHRDLETMCKEGTFREDLYYRLNVFPITVPPLRTWGNDIYLLALFFLNRYNKKYNGRKTFRADILSHLLCYEWPGNIRELEHILERLWISEDGTELTGEALSVLISPEAKTETTVHCSDIIPLKKAKAELEKQLLINAYHKYKSSYEVAKALDIAQSTVIQLKKKHNI